MLEQVLIELALLFALCVGVAVTFHRFRLPPIVGFLVAGVLVGPHGIGLVQHEAMVRELAEVGIVVLLFAVGLEVPLGQIARLKRMILVGGGLQVVGTVALATAVCLAIGMTWHQALFLGFLLSLSSTAASTKVLVDHGEFSAPHGRVVLGINIAQDLAVVPMILAIPLLGGGAGDGAGESLVAALRNLGILVVALVLVRFLVRPLLNLVCRTRSRELFVLFLATLCLAMASMTAHLGLSLALGAFLAGILLADSDHHSQAAAEVEPFRDAFASLFFVSIGMLFDWHAIAAAPLQVTLALTAVVVGKAAIIGLAAQRLGQPFWVRLRTGLTLAQVGEFSFVLVQLGAQSRLLTPLAERVFVVVAVLSIALTPLLYAVGRRIVARSRRGGDSGRSGDGGRLQDHAIVIGFGPTGRAVVAALRALGIPVVVAEMNANTVRAEKALGTPIVLGDATRVATLRALGIERARVLVLAVNDTTATSRIAQLAVQAAPHVHVLARVVYDNEVEAIRRAGAHDVVPQELEASVEMMVRALRRFLVTDDEIGRRVALLRRAVGAGERAAGTPAAAAARLADYLPGLGFQVWRVDPGAAVVGRRLADAGVRQKTGCSVVAVRRGEANLPAITPDTLLEAGDTVVVLGPEARLAEAQSLFVAAVDAVPAPGSDPAEPS